MQALIGAEGVNLVFEPAAVIEIATQAAEINRTIENIGARRLHTVIEKVVEDVSYSASDLAPGSTVTIDVAHVRRKLLPLLAKTDLSRFIL